MFLVTRRPIVEPPRRAVAGSGSAPRSCRPQLVRGRRHCSSRDQAYQPRGGCDAAYGSSNSSGGKAAFCSVPACAVACGRRRAAVPWVRPSRVRPRERRRRPWPAKSNTRPVPPSRKAPTSQPVTAKGTPRTRLKASPASIPNPASTSSRGSPAAVPGTLPAHWPCLYLLGQRSAEPRPVRPSEPAGRTLPRGQHRGPRTRGEPAPSRRQRPRRTRPARSPRARSAGGSRR